MFSPKFAALRAISGMFEEDSESNMEEYIKLYCEVLEKDMQTTCRSALSVVQYHLLPFSCVQHNVALYNKMVGDIYWYLAMLKIEVDKEKLIDDALAAYESASNAVESLPPADPLRLSVYLTKTAFYHDVKNWPERACAEGKQALDEAGQVLASLGLGEESYKERAEIMGLMKENLALWDDDDKSSNIAFFVGATSSSIFAAPSTDPEEQQPSLRTPDYSMTSPPPVVLLLLLTGCHRTVVPDTFVSPGDWGYELHEGLSENEIRFRKKAAQARRGRMG